MNEHNIEISLSELFTAYAKYEKKIIGDDEFTLYKNFISIIDKDKEIVQKWVNKIFTKTTIKNNINAKDFREKGNKYYIKKNYKEAIDFYSKSITHAEETSEELALAFANRSAVHFAQKCYQSCLKDIDNCKNVGSYPEKLKNKLSLREARCLRKLNLTDKSEKIINDLRQELETNNIDQSLEKFVKEIKDLQLEPPDDKDYNKQNDLGREYKISEVIDGPNSAFLYASASVKLVYDREKGRHVLANKNFEMGDILFVEKPYALVPTYCVDQNYKDRCYFCYKRTNSTIPCSNCDTIYCDKNCKKSAWLSFHKYECPGSCIKAWHQLGVSYLGLRIALLGIKYIENSQTVSSSQVTQFGSAVEDNYPYIWSMVTNIEKINNETKLINLTMAVCLCEYLNLKTTFFDDMSKNSNLTKTELSLRMGGIILRHLLQVTCNASMVDDFYENVTNILSKDCIGQENTYVRAVGMYPTHSMLNHSCDPNIALYFCDDVMIVKARRTIKIGEEICNSYGYSCYKEGTLYRQTELLKQYCFTCKCSACTYPTKPEIFADGLLCDKCNSCALPDCYLKTKYKCISCNYIFDAQNHHKFLEDAQNLVKDAQIYGNGFKKLIHCLEIRRKLVPENSELIRETLQMITEDNLIGFESWWKFTQQLIKVERHIIPYHSVTYANNIKFTIETLINYLEQESVNNHPNIDQIIKDVETMIIEIKRLYLLFHPPELLRLETIDHLFDIVTKMISEIKNTS